MAILQISYDLGSPESSTDYTELIKKIKSYGAWCKPEYSLWFIKTDKLTTTVRDELKPYLDKNDKLLVINVTGDHWAGLRLSDEVAAWLKHNV